MNELLQMLNTLNIYNSQENQLVLDANTIQHIFQDLIPKILSQKQYKELNIKHIPEDIQERSFYKLFIACRLMCEKLNIHDFSYNDLLDPEIKRIKNILNELAKYALHKQKMYQEIQSTLNHYKNASCYLQESTQQFQMGVGLLNEEKEFTKSLSHQYNEKLKLQKTAENTYQSTKQSFENLQQIYQEEQGKLLEKQRQLSYTTDQLSIHLEKKKQLQSRIVSNPDQLQQEYQESSSNLEIYQKEYQYEQKLSNLLEFKIKVLNRFHDKLKITQQKLNVMTQNNAKVQQQNEHFHNNQKEFKTLEGQNYELQLMISKYKEKIGQKEILLVDLQTQHTEIKKEKQSLVEQLEHDNIIVKDQVQFKEAHVNTLQLQKQKILQNITNLNFQVQDLYANSKISILNTINEIDSYANEIDVQLNLIFE